MQPAATARQGCIYGTPLLSASLYKRLQPAHVGTHATRSGTLAAAGRGRPCWHMLEVPSCTPSGNQVDSAAVTEHSFHAAGPPRPDQVQPAVLELAAAGLALTGRRQGRRGA